MSFMAPLTDMITWCVLNSIIFFGPGLHVSKVTGLRASTNNHASTVLALFEESIKAHGCPSRVHGDRGGGNIAVAVRMIMYQGPGRGSFLWGS